MRPFVFTALLLLSSPLLAAEMQVKWDLPYAEPKNERQTLDVYALAEGKNRPIVVWIHGGGWKQGDKRGVQKKAEAFGEKGFVFVSTNYRFFPDATVKEMMGDIAKAIRWTHDHAKEFGGDPGSIIVMGHSAGAHLAALVCTDERYLKAEGLSLAILKGCVPVDVSVYDIPKRLKDGGSVPPDTFITLFGKAEAEQRDLSPAAHVAKGKNIPPFLILHVADRPDTKAQSQWFADKLYEAGIPAKVVAAEGKTHGTINSDLGQPDDKPTQALWEFLEKTKLIRVGSEQDAIMGMELERNEKTSKIRIVRKPGVRINAVSDRMFLMRVFYQIAKVKNCKYFVNLKEWDDDQGGRIYIAGFTNTKDADLKQEFGQEYSYRDESDQPRRFISVSEAALAFEKKY